MPSNQEYKGKGNKGSSYDELSGVGTSSAGKTGTTGNLNDGRRDGGVGGPDLSDSGNLQSAKGQPGGTPAQGDSQRSLSNAGNSQQGGQTHQQSQQIQQNQQTQQTQANQRSREDGKR